MTCPDTSVIVPALGHWHVQHERARRALGRPTAVVGHCLLEAYSVLSRLPEPLRSPYDVVAEGLDVLFGAATVFPSADASFVLARLRSAGIAGGATYDGLIALTAANHGATILTLDARAITTYRALGAAYQLIA